jgi:hypothetical protein
MPETIWAILRLLGVANSPAISSVFINISPSVNPSYNVLLKLIRLFSLSRQIRDELGNEFPRRAYASLWNDPSGHVNAGSI